MDVQQEHAQKEHANNLANYRLMIGHMEHWLRLEIEQRTNVSAEAGNADLAAAKMY